MNYPLPLTFISVLSIQFNDSTSIITGTWRGQVPVAIKQLRDDRVEAMAGGYEQARNEFFKEARIFKLMQHPNLVQVGCLQFC